MSALTRCPCTDNPFIHFVYGNQNQVAQAVLLMQNGTLGQTCKSAPTGGYHKFGGTWRLSFYNAILFQQLHVSPPTVVCVTIGVEHLFLLDENRLDC